MLSTSCYDLLDGTLEEGDQLKITRELVTHFDRYDMLYGVRSRRSGNRIFIDIFLGFDPDKRVGDVERDIGCHPKIRRRAFSQQRRHRHHRTAGRDHRTGGSRVLGTGTLQQCTNRSRRRNGAARRLDRFGRSQRQADNP